MRLARISLAAVASLALATAASAATFTYSSTDTPKPVPETGDAGDMAPSTISVPTTDCGGRSVVSEVEVYIRVTHTWDGDLNFYLTSPDGQQITLWAAVGGSSDNFNVTIDDDALSNINSNVPGRYRTGSFPSPSMCYFDGETAAGDWVLNISDTAGGDLGTLDQWQLILSCEESRDIEGCGPDAGRERRGRGLGSWANNGRGNGDQQAPPGQHGDHQR